MPHDHGHVLARVSPRRARSTSSRRSPPPPTRAASGPPGRGKTAPRVLLRAAELLATIVAPDDQRRDDARPVEDGVPGGDRRRVRDDRLLALQRLLRAGALRRAADQQPRRVELRWSTAPLEGFIYAVSPFNFTAIGGNLTTAPALMGNTVIWKPASSAMLSGYYTLQAARGRRPAAGRHQLPARRRASRSPTRCSIRPSSAGIHFTGSTAVFNSMWKKVGENIGRYRCYPRLVGETGGKDFIVAHPSADPQEVAVAIARGGFEYQGRSARPRAASTCRSRSGATCRDRAIAMMKEIKVGDVARLPQLHGRGDRQEGVHEDQRATRRREEERDGPVRAARRRARQGYFIEPTLIETTDPGYRLLCEEIFGPVVTALRLSRRAVGRDARRSSTRRRRTR